MIANRRRRKTPLTLAFALGLLALAGCGEDDASGDGSEGGGAGGGESGSSGGGTGGITGGSAGSAGSSGSAGQASGGTGGPAGGASGSAGLGTGGNAGSALGGSSGSSSGGANGGASGSGSGSGGSASGASGSGGSASGASGSGGSAGGATVMGPRFIGRFTNDRRFAWSGATIALRFTGTAISVTLNDTGDNFFDAVVDGGTPRVLDLSSGTQTYEIATGLTNGPHEVRVTRRTEAFFNPTTFVSFSVPEASWLPSTVPNRRIEVIGDSITAGYGVEGNGPNCGFTANTENHSLTYEALAAKQLGADLHTEAWSGIGIYRNNSGETTGQMPERFPRILPDDAQTQWDFSRFVPHAVVVNLGTNDFATGNPGTAFQTAHQAFATELRRLYPSARIYLAVGPMLGGAEYTAARGYLQAALAARNTAGDDAIGLIEFATTMASEGYGCDYHPNEETNARMAATLVTRLRADLGW